MALMTQNTGRSGKMTISTNCIQRGFGLKKAMNPRTRLSRNLAPNGRRSGDNNLDRIGADDG